MKTFDEIYEELQNGENQELKETWEAAKEQSKKAIKTAAIICSIIDFFAIVLLLTSNTRKMSIFPVIFITLIINLFVFVITNIIFTGKERNKYNQIYKNEVIGKIMKNFYNNLEYFPYKPMPEYIYNQLNYEYYNIYKSDDYFEAQINNEYSIQMAEILTQEERIYKNKDGETEREVTTKFHGLFAKVEMNKSIGNELKIVQNGGMIFQKDRLDMDSSEFEKYFDVKASDKILGMQILTADVMEELVQFVNNTKMKYDIYIKDNELYLRFHSGAMFEAGSLKKEALDKETLEKYFYMLNFTYNLSNKLINVVNDTII